MPTRPWSTVFSVLLQYFFSDSFLHGQSQKSSANECKSMAEILLRVGPCRHNLKIEFAFFVFVLAKVFKFYSNLETDETKSTLLQKMIFHFFVLLSFFWNVWNLLRTTFEGFLLRDDSSFLAPWLLRWFAFWRRASTAIPFFSKRRFELGSLCLESEPSLLNLGSHWGQSSEKHAF